MWWWFCSVEKPKSLCNKISTHIYMVQYASFGNFYSNYGNFQNFDFALIFIVMHYTSSYISINSRNTLDNYRMRYNIWKLFPWVCTKHPKLGVFCYILKYSILVAGISQLGNKLQQCSLYEVIEDIMPFVLNTKRPLSDIWLLRYKQNTFGCFRKKFRPSICSKNTQNCFAYNSATKYRSEAVLYSKRTAWYPLSPHIKTIAVAFLWAE